MGGHAGGPRRDASFGPGPALRGTLVPPPDKSISHRAALVGAMSAGRTRIADFLDAADTRSTLGAIAALGAGVETAPGGRPGTLEAEIAGVGLRGARGGTSAAPLPIDVGNAGTLLRLIGGWLAGQPSGAWSLAGDASIARRPVGRVADPLAAMGARVSSNGGLPPLVVEATRLHGVRYEMPVASAQVKSCLLLAGLLADGPTTVLEPAPTRDHTERMLRAAGARVHSRETGTGLAVGGRLPPREITIEPAERLDPGPLSVPGDLSSAAFALCGALICSGSDLVIDRVGLNPTRIGLLGILNRMGAAIEVIEGTPQGGEPVGRIRARTAPLRGIRIGAAEVALSIDELPLVALLGCFADGTTVVSGAEELRHKESDRIATVVDGLSALGGRIEARPDGFRIEGTGGLRGGTIDAAGDHRLAMLGAIAGLASERGVEVLGFDACEVSYPGFEADLAVLAP